MLRPYYKERQMKTYEFKRSYELFERATRVVPNGIIQPRNPQFLTFGEFPCFIDHAKGCRLWDVDGNEFIDFMCAYGPMILGYLNPAVEEAARKQTEKGDNFSMPSPLWLEFAEYLVNLIPMADWAVFAKNGSDVTNYACRVARQHTKKKQVVMAKGAYHGFHEWSLAANAGIPDEYQTCVPKFEYNDIEDLERVFQEHKGDIAAVFLTPIKHDAMHDQELPAPGFFDGVRELCDKEGALMLFDDVRCGFRFDVRGTHEYFGADPDIVCFGKAISNGYPISAAVAKKEYMESARFVFFTGTHFHGAVEMAASMACLDEIQRSGAIDIINEMGKKLQEGLRKQAAAHGERIVVSGPPGMPFMRFEDDPTYERNRKFFGLVARRGIFLHPHHNWFVSAAHTEKDIRQALDVTDECFKLLKRL